MNNHSMSTHARKHVQSRHCNRHVAEENIRTLYWCLFIICAASAIAALRFIIIYLNNHYIFFKTTVFMIVLYLTANIRGYKKM